MNYYIDAEFCEGPQDKRVLGIKYGKTKPTIDLISLAIVAEDGRELYLISKDFNLREAWNRWQPRTGEGDRNNREPREYWIRENVLLPIHNELAPKEYGGSIIRHFSYENFKWLINEYGKTNKQIAEEVKEFCIQDVIVETDINVLAPAWPNAEMRRSSLSPPPKMKKDFPAFYGYYSAYDHVVFCWLFGRMIDLPTGFPMYTRDLKQMLDEKARSIIEGLCFGETKEEEDAMAERSIPGQIDAIKKYPNYPKQTNEHSALFDARWNRDLHNFIKSL